MLGGQERFWGGPGLPGFPLSYAYASHCGARRWVKRVRLKGSLSTGLSRCDPPRTLWIDASTTKTWTNRTPWTWAPSPSHQTLWTLVTFGSGVLWKLLEMIYFYNLGTWSKGNDRQEGFLKSIYASSYHNIFSLARVSKYYVSNNNNTKIVVFARKFKTVMCNYHDARTHRSRVCASLDKQIL